MTYDFEDVQTGEVIGLEYSVADVPEVGARIKHKGREYVRVASIPQIRCPADRNFVNRTDLPYNYKYHEDLGGKFDELGRCVFTSGKQVRELVAYANDHGERIAYTGSGVNPIVDVDLAKRAAAKESAVPKRKRGKKKGKPKGGY